MKSIILSLIAVLAIQQVTGHSIFQDLWVNGVDEISVSSRDNSCVRMPPSNSPVTDVTSTDLRCNVNGLTGVPGKCSVVAGQIVTVEMHAQPGDRSCLDIAIGGAHYGPVNVFLTKVTDSSTADGSTGWFKIFQDTWAHNASGATGDQDYWGTNDLNSCCGRMDVLIPAKIPAGDYLLRAEAIALHVAGSLDGAQFYMSCYQLTISSGGSASPGTVLIPGMYAATDPGILIDIHTSLSTYIDPGPTVYSGGTTKSAGAKCSSLVEAQTTTGTSYIQTNTHASSSATGTAGGGSTGGCTAAKYGQCGGTGWTGCTVCESGSTCKYSSAYYSQCL